MTSEMDESAYASMGYFLYHYMISSYYFYLIIIICLYTVIWFQVTNNNPY